MPGNSRDAESLRVETSRSDHYEYANDGGTIHLCRVVDGSREPKGQSRLIGGSVAATVRMLISELSLPEDGLADAIKSNPPSTESITWGKK